MATGVKFGVEGRQSTDSRLIVRRTFLLIGTVAVLMTTARAIVKPSAIGAPGQASARSNPLYRVQVYSKTAPQLPSAKDWILEYEFIVPPLPSSNTWDYKVGTVYQWGDIDFDEYGRRGKYKLSDYQYNQIVPELFLGNVLDTSDAAYAPSWHQRSTWGIEAQYYWKSASTSISYAQTGRVVNVNPGDEITTTILYDAKAGTIIASIADESLSGSASVSTITIARPFPNDPALFTSWTDFFQRAVAASQTPYIMSTLAADVETYYLDQATMCGLLPFTLKKISIPGVSSTASTFAIQPGKGLTCPQPMAKFDFLEN